MAKKKSEGDEGRSWAELIFHYNQPYQLNDASQSYKNSQKSNLYFCPECDLCYELLPNTYKRIYACEHLWRGFPTRGVDDRKACPTCSPEIWGQH